jgi:hypothetical protein
MLLELEGVTFDAAGRAELDNTCGTESEKMTGPPRCGRPDFSWGKVCDQVHGHCPQLFVPGGQHQCRHQIGQEPCAQISIASAQNSGRRWESMPK